MTQVMGVLSGSSSSEFVSFALSGHEYPHTCDTQVCLGFTFLFLIGREHMETSREREKQSWRFRKWPCQKAKDLGHTEDSHGKTVPSV